jgi:hypothetical protein
MMRETDALDVAIYVTINIALLGNSKIFVFLIFFYVQLFHFLYKRIG